MNIPSFSRRPGRASMRDGNRDGRIDDRDAMVTGTERDTEPVAVDNRADGASTARGPAVAPAIDDRTDPVEARRAAVDRAESERAAAERAADRAESERFAERSTDPIGIAPVVIEPDADQRPDEAPAVLPAGPRPRASFFATLSLIIGVAAALFVLTGVLAGYGIALGVAALLASIGGISATSRRHVAGRSNALAGLVLGLGAIVFGALAFTGTLPWLTADTDNVGRLREWLDAQLVNRF